MKWLFTPEKTIGGKLRNIVLGFLACLIWSLFVTTLLRNTYFFPNQIFGSPSPYYLFLTACIVAPLWEELVFRYAPITLVKKFGRGAILSAVAISSFVFALGHTRSPHPILIEGVSGFFLSCVYIKNDYSYWSSVTVHFMWNLMVFIIYMIK